MSLILLLFSSSLFLVSCKNKEAEVNNLILELENKDPIIRRKATIKLAQMDKKYSSLATTSLIKALDDGNWNVKNGAAHALKRINSKESTKALSQALPYYLISLKSSNTSVRWHAASGLGYFGKSGVDAIPTLKKIATSDKERSVRNIALFSLRKLNAYK